MASLSSEITVDRDRDREGFLGLLLLELLTEKPRRTRGQRTGRLEGLYYPVGVYTHNYCTRTSCSGELHEPLMQEIGAAVLI